MNFALFACASLLVLFPPYSVVAASNLRSAVANDGGDGNVIGENLALDQRRLGNPSWSSCEGSWMWVPRQDCVPDVGIVCKPGWKEGSVPTFCYFMVDECTELDNPCNILPGTENDPTKGPKCVDLAPDNGLYKCVCPFGVNGLNNLGFGPTVCADKESCAFDSSLCDTENGGFCTTDEDGGSFYCSCPPGHKDVNGDGSSCPLSEQDFPTSSCETIDCPAGQVCGTLIDGTGEALCVNDGDSSDDDPKNAKDEVSCESATFECDWNQFCGIHPDRGAVCFCREGFWQVHPHGDCKEEVKATCQNCSPLAECGANLLCSCMSGYVGNGEVCVDQNECDLGLDNCTPNSQGCINIDGGFECVDIIVVTPPPSPGPTPRAPTPRAPTPRAPPPAPAPTPPVPTPQALITSELQVTLKLDSDASTENKVVVYNTFDNNEVFLEKSDLREESTLYTGTVIPSNGCYTLVIYDTGSSSPGGGSTTKGLANSASVQVNIGNLSVLDEVLAPSNRRVEFSHKAFRFGNGCDCASGRAAYDITVFDTTATTSLTVTDKDPSVPVFLAYDNIAPNSLIDTRICTSSCHEIVVTGSPSEFKVSKAVLSDSETAGSDDLTVALGAPTSLTIGNNCCPSGQKLLQERFFNPEESASSVSRTLNSILSSVDAPAGYSATSQCVSNPACLKYTIPSTADFSYLINLDDDVRTGTVTTQTVAEEFGASCEGNLKISIQDRGQTGTTSVLLFDLLSDLPSQVDPSYLHDGAVLLNEDIGVNQDLVDHTFAVSETGCYSFSIVNPSGDNAALIDYSVKFNGETQLASSNSGLRYPEGASAPVYDTIRLGGGCGCPNGQDVVDFQLLTIGNTGSAVANDELTLHTSQQDLSSSNTVVVELSDENGKAPVNAVYDFRTCVDKSNQYFDPSLSKEGKANDYFLTMSVNNMDVVRTSEAANMAAFEPFNCDPDDEHQLTLSRTDADTSFSISLQTLGDTSVISSAHEVCIPQEGCTAVSFDESEQTFSGEFILAKDYKEILASGEIWPTSPILVGKNCSTAEITVAGASVGADTTTVYMYDATKAIATNGLFLEEVIDVDSQTYTEVFDSTKCYTVAVVAELPSELTATTTVVVDGVTQSPAGKDASYVYYEIGNCICASDEKEVSMVWFTPLNVESFAATLHITRRGANNENPIDDTARSNFLYNYRACAAPDICLGVSVEDNRSDRAYRVAVQHFFSAYYDNVLMFDGIFNKDNGSVLTPACCGSTQQIAIVSFHIGRQDDVRLGVTREIESSASSTQGSTTSVTTPQEGQSSAQHYCYGTPTSTDDCQTISLTKTSNRIFNLGEDGFVRVAYPGSNDSLLKTGDSSGTDFDDPIVIGLGSNDCAKPTVGFD